MTRTRFAPSPTGEFHVGSARTALFNWLHARRTGGAFVLRIEDTDAARNTPEARAAIFDSLAWLGLDWDEGPLPEGRESDVRTQKGEHGPYCQSQRAAIYQSHIERLLSEGRAYEEDGAVRFRMPRETIRVADMICGDIEFDLREQGDLVIRRSNGAPVFHLVNVVDDLEMNITHVIRGEDHLSNTPKHIALYAGLGAEPPRFAHIPLILNANGSKMSKRDQGATIAEYRRRGFLPAAVVNYLCLLGWTPPGDGPEIMSLEEIASRFDLTAINRSNARFDPAKLAWMNGEYLRQLDPQAFTQQVLGFFPPGERESDTLRKIIPLYQEKVQIADEVLSQLTYFKDGYAISEKAAKKLEEAEAKAVLRTLADGLEALDPFDAAGIEGFFNGLVETSGLKIGAYMAPCRAAVTGQMGGPSLYPILESLGKQRVAERLKRNL